MLRYGWGIYWGWRYNFFSSVVGFIDILEKYILLIYMKTIIFESYAASRIHENNDIDMAIVSPELGYDRIEEMILTSQSAYNAHGEINTRAD
ncbi:MAG: hypothetical protein A4E55_00417 [Pelotomaculum sp. PtaU1.Bin035]|nr:MAG: hypothetical protein A4E55_00417 [Pelotomaculum sp. PtaU1.Bin035]